MGLFDRKPIVTLDDGEHGMRRTLGAGDLVMWAIGAVIGAGIFSSLGTAAAGETLADGTIVVNDAAVSLDELDALIDEAIDVAGGADKLKPLIRADRDCDSARLNEVFTRLSSRGLPAIRLATERGR